MAEAFRAYINAVTQRGTEQYVAELQRQLAEIAPWRPTVR